MIRMKRYCRNLLLSIICLIIALAPCNVSFAEERVFVDGEIQFVFDGDTLTVSAVEGSSGQMNGYEFAKSPIMSLSQMKSISYINIDDSVTSLGENVFNDLSSDLRGIKYRQLTIGKGVTSIPRNFCSLDFDRIVIGDSVTSISTFAFYMSDTDDVYLPKGILSLDIPTFLIAGGGKYLIPLKRVYGYSGSKAEKWVEKMNDLIKDKSNNTVGSLGDDANTRLIEFVPRDGGYEDSDAGATSGNVSGANDTNGNGTGATTGTNGVGTTTSQGVTGSGAETSNGAGASSGTTGASLTVERDDGYTLTVICDYTDDAPTYSYKGQTSKAEMVDDNNNLLKNDLTYFNDTYKESDLKIVDIVLRKGETSVDLAGNCIINLPVPSDWASKASDVKVLVWTEGVGIQTVTSSVTQIDGKNYISFMAPHFSAYALYLDSAGETSGANAESGTTPEVTDAGTGDEVTDAGTGTGDIPATTQNNNTANQEATNSANTSSPSGTTPGGTSTSGSNTPTANNQQSGNTSGGTSIDDTQTPKTAGEFNALPLIAMVMILVGIGLIVLPHSKTNS